MASPSHLKSVSILFLILPFAVSALQTVKFVSWYPQFEADLGHSWTSLTSPCHVLWTNYVYKHQGECGHVLNCILENTSELRKSTITCAQVVLSITPSLLSHIGSSVAEIALLGSHRPVLSFLLVIGAPACYQSRSFKYRDPDQTPYRLPSGLQIRPSRSWMWPLIVLCQYIFAGAAVANNIDVMLQMGTRAVLAWACNSWYMPMFWVLLSAATYFLAVLSHMPDRIQWRPLVQLFISEFTPTIAAAQSAKKHLQERSAARAILQHVASVVALVQIILGTLIFASMFFIGFHDTVLILLRLFASALVCKFIFMSELVGLREQD